MISEIMEKLDSLPLDRTQLLLRQTLRQLSQEDQEWALDLVNDYMRDHDENQEVITDLW